MTPTVKPAPAQSTPKVSTPKVYATRDEIIAAVVTKELTPDEAGKLLDAMTPKGKIPQGGQISNGDFLAKAGALIVHLGEVDVQAEVKQFSTGSVGWSYSGKMLSPLVDGKRVRCQVSLNITVIGSKGN